MLVSVPLPLCEKILIAHKYQVTIALEIIGHFTSNPSFSFVGGIDFGIGGAFLFLGYCSITTEYVHVFYEKGTFDSLPNQGETLRYGVFGYQQCCIYQ